MTDGQCHIKPNDSSVFHIVFQLSHCGAIEQEHQRLLLNKSDTYNLALSYFEWRQNNLIVQLCKFYWTNLLKFYHEASHFLDVVTLNKSKSTVLEQYSFTKLLSYKVFLDLVHHMTMQLHGLATTKLASKPGTCPWWAWAALHNCRSRELES